MDESAYYYFSLRGVVRLKKNNGGDFSNKKNKNYDIALYVFFMKKKNHLRLRFFFAGFFVDIVILSSSPTHGNNLVNDCIKSFIIKLI